jgi:hypothetical protein
VRLHAVCPLCCCLLQLLSQGLLELKSAMFTSNQMQQIEKASAALTSSGDSVMTRVELQQLYDEVFPRNFLRAMSVPL